MHFPYSPFFPYVWRLVCQFLGAWHGITIDHWLLEIIQFRYAIQFHSILPSISHFHHHLSNLCNEILLRAKMGSFSKMGAIEGLPKQCREGETSKKSISHSKNKERESLCLTMDLRKLNHSTKSLNATCCLASIIQSLSKQNGFGAVSLKEA